MIWFALSIVLGAIIYLKVIKPLGYWKKKGVVYKTPFPIIGNLSGMFAGKGPFKMNEEMYNNFPNSRYNGIFMFGDPWLLIRDLDLIKQITVKDFDHFMDHKSFINEELDPLLCKNLVGLKGQKWKDMRATLSPAFTSSKMRAMFPLMYEAAQQFTNYFLNNPEEMITLEMKEAYTKFTNDVIATTAFGIQCDSFKDENNSFYAAGREFSKTSVVRLLSVLGYTVWPWLMKTLKVQISPEHLSNFFRKIVKDSIDYREKEKIIRPDLIHLLMEARKGKLKHEDIHAVDAGFATVEESEIGKSASNLKTELSDDDITAQAFIFFLAGFETSSTIMSFLSHELAVNPDIQEKLHQEIERAFENSERLTYEVLLGMKYLDAVISETLRKWPVGFQLERICVKEYTIEPMTPEEKPLLIEKGISMTIPVYGIHHDRNYFPSPHKFDPERFSDENKGKITPGSYMPFGVGPRNCIGSRFALLEIKAMIVQLVSKFEIVVVEKTKIPIDDYMDRFKTMPKDGYWLGLKKR